MHFKTPGDLDGKCIIVFLCFYFAQKYFDNLPQRNTSVWNWDAEILAAQGTSKDAYQGA